MRWSLDAGVRSFFSGAGSLCFFVSSHAAGPWPVKISKWSKPRSKPRFEGVSPMSAVV